MRRAVLVLALILIAVPFHTAATSSWPCTEELNQWEDNYAVVGWTARDCLCNYSSGGSPGSGTYWRTAYWDCDEASGSSVCHELQGGDWVEVPCS